MITHDEAIELLLNHSMVHPDVTQLLQAHRDSMTCDRKEPPYREGWWWYDGDHPFVVTQGVAKVWRDKEDGKSLWVSTETGNNRLLDNPDFSGWLWGRCPIPTDSGTSAASPA